MASQLNICMFPQEITWGDKPHNLAVVAQAMQEVHPDTDIVVLPEMFSTGFITKDKEEVREMAERNSGETVDFLMRLAAKHNKAIAGSFVADTGGSLFNRAFFIEPDGETTFADKRHLFRMGGEDKIFSQGYERMRVRFRSWNIAMVICYDLRFPVWCRNVDNEYDLMIAVANWPKVRIDTWNTLLRARAMENLSYVVGVNCRGVDPSGHEYDGASAAIDFKGKDISMRHPSSPFAYASLSKEKLQAFRDKFPAWNDADRFKLLDDIF